MFLGFLETASVQAVTISILVGVVAGYSWNDNIPNGYLYVYHDGVYQREGESLTDASTLSLTMSQHDSCGSSWQASFKEEDPEGSSTQSIILSARGLST